MVKVSPILFVFILVFILSCGGGGGSTSSSSTTSSTGSTSSTTSGTGNSTTLVSITAEKFTPPTGTCVTTDPDSPCPRRILLATSTDGQTYTRSGVVLSDQANTPNMIQLASGRIIVYYTGSYLDVTSTSTPRDAIAAAVSDDQGVTWSYYKTVFTGFGTGAPIVDPDIILLEDGTFRMYVTRGIGTGSSAKVGVLWADSPDGFNFTYGGIAATIDGNIVDSLTYKIGSTYHMQVLNPVGSGVFSYFTSSDGKTFTFVSDTLHLIGTEPYILSNWLPEASGVYRIFAFGFPNADIRSFETTDGKTLTAGTKVHLKFSEDTTKLEKTWVKDAAVIKLPSATYLMAYVSETP